MTETIERSGTRGESQRLIRICRLESRVVSRSDEEVGYRLNKQIGLRPTLHSQPIKQFDEFMLLSNYIGKFPNLRLSR